MENIELLPQSNLVLSLLPSLKYIKFIFSPTLKDRNLTSDNVQNKNEQRPIENPLKTVLFYGMPLEDYCKAVYIPKTLLNGNADSIQCVDIMKGSRKRRRITPEDQNILINRDEMNNEDNSNIIMKETSKTIQTQTTEFPQHTITFNCGQLGVFLEISLYNSGRYPVSVTFPRNGIDKFACVTHSIFVNVPTLKKQIQDHIKNRSMSYDTMNASGHLNQNSETSFVNIKNNSQRLPPPSEIGKKSQRNSSATNQFKSEKQCILVIGDDSVGKTSFCRFWSGLHHKEKWAVCDLSPGSNMISLPGTLTIGVQTGKEHTWGTFSNPWVWYYGYRSPFIRLPEYCAILQSVAQKLNNLNLNTIIKMPACNGQSAVKLVSMIIENMGVNSIVLLGEHAILKDKITKQFKDVLFTQLQTNPEECFLKGKKRRAIFKKRVFKEYFYGRCNEFTPQLISPEKKMFNFCKIHSSTPQLDNIPFKDRYLQAITVQNIPANRDLMCLLIGVSSAERMNDIPVSTVRGFVYFQSTFQNRVQILSPVTRWSKRFNCIIGNISYLPAALDTLDE